jgi:hypothetical protein
LRIYVTSGRKITVGTEVCGLRRVRLAGIENSHHFIMMDQPDRFRAELHRFHAAPAAARQGRRQ